jgi:hypothetical protein
MVRRRSAVDDRFGEGGDGGDNDWLRGEAVLKVEVVS